MSPGLDPEQAVWVIGLGLVAYMGQKVKEFIDKSFAQVAQVTEGATARVLEVQHATSQAFTDASRVLVYTLSAAVLVIAAVYILVHSHLMWKMLMRKSGMEPEANVSLSAAQVVAFSAATLADTPSQQP